ncbi:hypothetical protein H7U07_22720 [Bacillus cereus]|nr:hypothetical protein [Bacillus cereus]
MEQTCYLGCLLSIRIKQVFMIIRSFYPAICQEVRSPPQNSAKVKKLDGGPAARKSPIGEG